ncbi:protein bunched, class 2/F/G isoform-like isoform X2 [Podarcis raffonei]|uniref:protein bunched, class 2/F/G isoform-like isoform X2 n=1 Tax=Podarcis raffonei TaxID=65483 RepID=UPI0023299306|nr:protein bunched, class 2/F/G isoform-like isoform X2 [Podarcis raffonei]
MSTSSSEEWSLDPLASPEESPRRGYQRGPRGNLTITTTNQALVQLVCQKNLHQPADTTLLSILLFFRSDPDSRAIGDKIEQALDLVKTHLVYAVREEVDLLKDQIQELLEKNGRLQRENHLLKNLASPEQLQNLESCQPLQVRPPCPEDLRARKMKVHQDLEILLPGPSRKPNSHLRSGSSSLNAEPGIPPT